MPNRIIREGILTSERIDGLGSWASEVFYRRLMSVVDDHGRYYANASLLRAACYPLKLDKVSNADVEKWLADCAGAALVSTYEIEGKRYLQLQDFRQQVRAKASKFPQPPAVDEQACSACVADAQQVIADAHLVVVGVEDGGEAAPKSRRRSPKTALPADFGLSERVIDWAKVKGYDHLQAHLDAFKLKAVANDYRYADWDAALMGAIEQDWARINSRPRLVPQADKFAGAI